MPEQLETERLVLRKPRLDDTRDIFEDWAQDHEVTRYLTWLPHQRIEKTQVFVQSCLLAWEREARFLYMITRKESGKVIGMIDPRLEGPKIGIGYAAARVYWGKGCVPEAARALIRFGISPASHLSRLHHNGRGESRFSAGFGESRDALRRNFA